MKRVKNSKKIQQEILVVSGFRCSSRRGLDEPTPNRRHRTDFRKVDEPSIGVF